LCCKGPSIADVCEGLKRRGPDSLNTETLYVTASELRVDASVENSVPGPCIRIDFVGALLSLRGDRPVSQPVKDSAGNVLVYNGTFTCYYSYFGTLAKSLVVVLGGDDFVLVCGSGEVFGGLGVQPGENDTVVLMAALGACCACACHATPSDNLCACNTQEVHKTVQEILSALRGPWALVYWQVNLTFILL
jgi:hypothetical protein